MQFHSREEAITWLYSRVDFERMSPSLTASDFKLDRMRNLLNCLGNPQEKIPVVHIAGTKGKGSTAAVIASVLTAAGYSVGLFTSPHIDRFEERIRVSGEEISEKGLTSLVSRLAEVAVRIDAEGKGLSPTFFELSTALAWLWFSECDADIAVLEVGLGGRLDSTNICRPEVSVITTISRDHTHILGTRLADIAREKAGIIKERVPVVTGVADGDALSVISKIASDHGSRLTVVEPGSVPAGVSSGAGGLIATLGTHQRHNACVAISAVRELTQRGWKITAAAIEQGLRSPSNPVRIERLGENPTVIVDAAHNWISAGALVETVQALPADGKRVLVFGTSTDKDVRGLCRRLFPHFDAVILTRYESTQRGISLEALASIASAVSTHPVHLAEDPASAWQAAQDICPENGLICVAGSFFLAAEIRRLIRR